MKGVLKSRHLIGDETGPRLSEARVSIFHAIFECPGIRYIWFSNSCEAMLPTQNEERNFEVVPC